MSEIPAGTGTRRRVVLLGGSGFIGRALAETLLREDPATLITVPTRRARHARALWPLPGVHTPLGSVHDDAALAGWLQGADAVVNLVGILHGSQAEFDRVHAELPARLARAAGAAGVPRIVHVSALGVGDDAPSRYLRSKTAGEAALRRARPDARVLRPSVVFGAGDRFINLFAALQRWLPVMALGGAGARLQPVWVGDVAAALAALLRRPDLDGALFEAVGPRAYTLAELVRLAGRWSGHERPVLKLPDALARLQALAMELLPGEPLMSRDNLDSLRAPGTASGTLPTLEALGITPRALEAVMAPLLSGTTGVARLDAWRAARRR